MAEPMLGGCVCGAVRYRVTAEPIAFYVCHCTDCQRRTGSAFGLMMIVRTETLELISGSPTSFKADLPGGRRDRGGFCPACAVKLWYEHDAYPQIRGLLAGTLDDAPRYAPHGDVWTRSARSWVSFTGGPRFEQQPDDPLALVNAWRDFRRASRSTS
jgi:hypothetical protein